VRADLGMPEDCHLGVKRPPSQPQSFDQRSWTESTRPQLGNSESRELPYRSRIGYDILQLQAVTHPDHA
jgi:hypothetical protein